uniref:Uncharacterized protein n=1 Tax=Acrobeloides nanus TaxID=290746 RepID=A0A914D1K5_9BILA
MDRKKKLWKNPWNKNEKKVQESRWNWSHINRSLKNWMSNKVYDGLDELVDDVKVWIASKNRGFFER